MNLDIVREKMAQFLHKNVTVTVYGLRNKNFEYYFQQCSKQQMILIILPCIIKAPQSVTIRR